MLSRSAVGFGCAVILIAGCMSSRTSPNPTGPDRGVASWYGQEYAGRTTANGEIFDPVQLTAAHRTLPFGTVVEVRNLENDRTVRVRINDRGPFIGGRIIDLSYGAARQIGLVERGIGEVQIRVLQVGAGELEPPRPIVVNADIPTPAAPPSVEFPLPEDTAPLARNRQSATRETAVVDQIVVEEIRDGVPVRRQVSEDGRTIEEVPMTDGRGIPAPRISAPRPAASSPVAATRAWDLQLGAFAAETNARTLVEKVRALSARVRIEPFDGLHRVRIGPFATREAAIEERERLEAAGIDSLVVPAS